MRLHWSSPVAASLPSSFPDSAVSTSLGIRRVCLNLPTPLPAVPYPWILPTCCTPRKVTPVCTLSREIVRRGGYRWGRWIFEHRYPAITKFFDSWRWHQGASSQFWTHFPPMAGLRTMIFHTTLWEVLKGAWIDCLFCLDLCRIWRWQIARVWIICSNPGT